MSSSVSKFDILNLNMLLGGSVSLNLNIFGLDWDLFTRYIVLNKQPNSTRPEVSKGDPPKNTTKLSYNKVRKPMDTDI